MGARSGTALRGTQFFLRFIQFCCAAIVLGIFSYFLAVLSNHSMSIGNSLRAVEGISGAAVGYTILATFMLCCAGGHSFPAFLTMVFDAAFAVAFIYVASVNRGGASSCSGNVDTVIGSGNSNTNVVDNGHGGFTQLPSLRLACKLETASLAVSIIAILFFVMTPPLSIALVRHRRKERRYDASPANNYNTTQGGYGSAPPRKRFNWFGLGRKRNADGGAGPDPNALPAHATPDDMARHSYATEATRVGSSGGPGVDRNKFEPAPYGNLDTNVGGGGDTLPMHSYGNEQYPNNNGMGNRI